MKRIKPIAMSISLSFIFSCLFVSLHASNEYSHYLNSDSCTGKQKVQVKGTSNQNLKITPQEYTETFEQNYKIDSLMQNNDFNEEPIKDSSEIKDRMINCEPVKTPCSNNQSDFIEKEWMNKHNFLIL